MTSVRNGLLPLIYFFLSLTVLFLGLWVIVPGKSVNFPVLLAGNFLLFIVSLVSMTLSVRALLHKNTQGFLRLVYGSFLFKFFVLGLGAIIYIGIYKKDINKPALLGCCGLYFIYTFIELRSVMKRSKQRNA